MRLTVKVMIEVLAGFAAIIACTLAWIDFHDRRPDLNLTGEWHIENTITQTTYRPFLGLRLGYRVFVNQSGRRFTGEGEKCWENDRSIPMTAHTPIHIDGEVRGDVVEATFVEEGTRRKSSGRFRWTVVQTPLHVEGQFTSTAASAGGPSTARRLTTDP